MYKGYPFSKTTYYRRKRKARAIGCDIMDVPDNRGKHNQHRHGSVHYRWQRGRLVRSDGYVIIRIGRTHPLSDSNGYALEHRVVWASSGRELGNDDVLHHVNGDTMDNRIENLRVMTNAEHSTLHRKLESQKRRELDGRLHEETPW